MTHPTRLSCRSQNTSWNSCEACGDAHTTPRSASTVSERRYRTLVMQFTSASWKSPGMPYDGVDELLAPAIGDGCLAPVYRCGAHQTLESIIGVRCSDGELCGKIGCTEFAQLQDGLKGILQ